MPRIKLRAGTAEFEETISEDEMELNSCDMPGCCNKPEYKAPKDRSLSDHYNFCFEHVQEYNRAWDYFSGMSSVEIEESMFRSLYGDRPTWKYGVNGNVQRMLEGMAWQTYHFRDDAPPRQERNDTAKNYRNTPEFEAMAIMGLAPPLTFKGIRSKYKELVKKYHPDKNQGDRKAEETLKSINMAYTVLKMAYEKYEKLEDK
jgi:DnaJ-domain-containing protein 1